MLQQKASFNNILPLKGPLTVDFFFGMRIPESTSLKKKEQLIKSQSAHTCKPDRTNLLKLYEDCLQRAGIIHNDSQIYNGHIRKFYAEKPHTVILIHPDN